MRVELPEGYVPPEPTHPMYGYLTPQEQAAFEAEERARRGIVPGAVAETELQEVEEAEEATSSWAPAAASLIEPVSEPVSEAEEATVARTGWVPAPPPAPPPEPAEPVALGAVGEFRWDASRQEWVSTATPAPVAAEQAVPDVAAAAGGRGASSSWTTADGQRLRWDARAQRWVTEPPDGRA
jgi:hypothetical protein